MRHTLCSWCMVIDLWVHTTAPSQGGPVDERNYPASMRLRLLVHFSRQIIKIMMIIIIAFYIPKVYIGKVSLQGGDLGTGSRAGWGVYFTYAYTVENLS